MLLPVYSLLAAGDFSYASDWPTFLGDAAHSGYTSNSASPPLSQAWEFNAGNAIHSSPSKAGYLVFIGTANGTLHAVHVQTGNAIWQFQADGMVVSAPAAADGKVVLTTKKGKVYALGQTSGAQLWSRDLGGAIYSSPTIADGRVFVSVGEPANKVAALSLSTGATLWEFAAGQPFYSTPAAADGMVWVGCDDGVFYGLDSSSGAQIAARATGGMIYTSSPAIANGVVFGAPGEYDLNVYAFNAQTGAPVWQAAPFPGDSIVKVSSVISSGGKVYLSIGYPQQKIAALNASDGQLAWQATLGDVTGMTFAPSPAAASSTLYVCTTDGTLHIFNTSTGASLGTVSLGGPTDASPAIADGMVFVSTRNGSLIAYLGSDNSQPTASLNNISSPVSGTITISGTATDDSLREFIIDYGAGASPTSWTQLTYSNLPVENGTITTWYTAEAADGDYTIRLVATDNSNNSATATMLVTVDNTPPAFTGIQYAQDTTTGGTVDISWTPASDPHTPITYYVYHSTASGAFDYDNPAAMTTQTQLQIGSLTNGTTYYFSVRAADAVGNMDENTAEKAVTPTDGTTADKTPPSFAGIISGAALGTDGAISISYNEAYDPSTPITYNIYISTTSGDYGGFSTPSHNASQTTFVTPSLVNGRTYYFVVRAADAAGNEDDNTVEMSAVPVDTTSPTIQITYPADGSILNSTLITVNGTTDPYSTLTLNGNTIVVQTDGTFTTSVSLAEGSNTLQFVAEDPSGNKGYLNLSVTVDTTPPVATITSPAAGETVSGSVAITGAASDAALANYKVEYGATASPSSWTAITESTQNVTGGTLATWDASKFGGTYTMRLTAMDVAGNSTSASVQVTVSNPVTVSGVLTAGEWHMMSLPMQPDQTSPKAVFGTTGYKIIRWDPQKAEPDPYALNYVSPGELRPGEAFFIKPYDNDLSYTIHGKVADTTADYSIALHSGWNQVGSPYDREFSIGTLKVKKNGTVYNFDDAAGAGLIASVLFSYENGGYSMNESSYNMIPWIGYFLKAYDDVDLLFDSTVPEPISATRALAKIIRPRLKGLRISARAAGLRDDDNLLGISPDGADGFDRKDVEEPPRSADRYLSLYFTPSEPERSTERLANDVRLTFSASKEWRMNVETSATTTVTIEWDASELAAGRYSVILTDIVSGTTVNMLETGSYSYTPSGASPRAFTITVTASSASQTETVSHTLHSGWNLLSFPIEPEVTNALVQLGDDISKMNVFQFHDRKMYTVHDEEGVDIQAGIGYWVHVEENITVDVEGAPTSVGVPIRVPLEKGWNLIGDPYTQPIEWGDNISVSYSGVELPLSEAAARGWLDMRLFEYIEGAYAEVPEGGRMEPWKGYFVKTNVRCELIIK
ncbi:MAG: PQQ-binding-like beta-propeller repeat protein [bacterium]